jgi:GT2 family glycosyltransferase
VTPFELVSWPAKSELCLSDDRQPRRTLNLSGLRLQPNWYRLRVWLNGPLVPVTARASFAEGHRADLRMHLEPRDSHRLEKVFKVSDPLSSIDIAAEGGKSQTHISRIEIAPLSKFSVLRFLAEKSVRYAISHRDQLDWVDGWKRLRAAFRPRASFAFQGRYSSGEDAAAYARWRAIHENAADDARIAQLLDKKLGDGSARIALILGDDIDENAALATTRLFGEKPGKLELVPVRAAVLKHGGGERDNWDFALPLDRPGFFPALGIERLLLALLESPDNQAVFADSDSVAADGARAEPLLKPPLWDPELLWCSDYIKAPLLLRWNPKIGEFIQAPGATQYPSYALALGLSASYARTQLKHLPAILFHESGAAGQLPRTAELPILNAHLLAVGHPSSAREQLGVRRVAWPSPAGIRVSIIIPSKDNPELLAICIESIRQQTVGLEPEILVADNGSVKPATRAYLRRLELTGAAMVVPCPGPFNFSKINNDARRHATGNILVFLNDDTRVIAPDWLVELVSLAARPEVGAVGALLLYPDGTVQHAGILLGIRGIADHAFRRERGDAPGYLDLLRCRREVTAVTGACLAVSAAHFDAVGGFDETLAVTANDIDLCLKLRARGWTNLWSPWSILEHAESKSRGVDFTNTALDRQGQENFVFSERWGSLLDCDPYYHPGLSRVAPDFSLGIE